MKVQAIKINFKRSAEAVRLAEKIVKIHEFVPKAHQDCRECGGSGEVDEISHHNGDPYTADCHCVTMDRPSVYLSEWDKNLLEIARFFLQDGKIGE